MYGGLIGLIFLIARFASGKKRGRVSFREFRFFLPIIAYVAMSFAYTAHWTLGIAALCVLVVPWAFTRYVLLPLGLARVAWGVMWFSFMMWQKDRRGGQNFAAAYAYCRSRRANLPWLETQLRKTKRVGGGSIGAMALIAQLRGDDARARQLMKSVLTDLNERATPATVLRLASEWVAADAAERGDWSDVIHFTSGHSSRAGNFLRICARRFHTGAKPVHSFWLVTRWLIAPRRRHTRALLQRALAIKVPPRIADDAPTTSNSGRDALALHVEYMRDAAPRNVTPLARTWERALNDEDLRRRTLERAVRLDVDAAMHQQHFYDTVVLDLVAYVNDRGAKLRGELGELGRSVASRLREALLAELDDDRARLAARLADKRALASIDEWQEWLALQAKWERANELGIDTRRVAHSMLHAVVCKQGVWLFNERKEWALANAMFAWLLAEANAVNDAAEITLQTKNINASWS